MEVTQSLTAQIVENKFKSQEARIESQFKESEIITGSEESPNLFSQGSYSAKSLFSGLEESLNKSAYIAQNPGIDPALDAANIMQAKAKFERGSTLIKSFVDAFNKISQILGSWFVCFIKVL